MLELLFLLLSLIFVVFSSNLIYYEQKMAQEYIKYKVINTEGIFFKKRFVLILYWQSQIYIFLHFLQNNDPFVGHFNTSFVQYPMLFQMQYFVKLIYIAYIKLLGYFLLPVITSPWKIQKHYKES